MNRPMTVESAPNRIVSSNAMITHAGSEMIGLPPVTSGQSIDVQVASAKPLAAPVRPPTSVNSRTGLSSVSSACSMSWFGAGVNTVGRFTPRSRSSWIALTVASTESKMPRTPGLLVALIGSVLLCRADAALRLRSRARARTAQRCGQNFLQLRDGDRGQDPHEQQEPHEEPAEAAGEDRHLGPARHVVAPLPGLVLVRE